MVTNPNDYSKSWEETYGIDKDPVRKHIVFPLFLKRVGDANPKTIADLGCGNGSMINNILNLNFESLTAIDMNDDFLKQAQNHIKDSRVQFFKENLMEMSRISLHSIDVALSVFVINELDDLDRFFLNVSRILAPLGRLFLICTHPFVSLISKKREDWGIEQNRKIIGVDNYFKKSSGRYYFTLSGDYADYHHYNIEHIVNAITAADLRITNVLEIGSNDPAFEAWPQYWQTKDLPKYLFLEVSN